MDEGEIKKKKKREIEIEICGKKWVSPRGFKRHQ